MCLLYKTLIRYNNNQYIFMNNETNINKEAYLKFSGIDTKLNWRQFCNFTNLGNVYQVKESMVIDFSRR